MNSDYKAAGVDVAAGYKAVALMRDSVRSTFRPEVLSDLGGFGGLFSLKKAKDMEDPVLVSGTDSVGTKIMLAFWMDKHDTVGIDCVAMSVDDVVCSGAEPLYFLDYIGCGKNHPETIAEVVKGVAEGCRQAGVAIIGGETAELPGLYKENEYDLVGFAVGLLERSRAIDGSRVVPGDVIIGLASSGLHSNGFALVRKVFQLSQRNVGLYVESLGKTLGEELLTPTRIYAQSILSVLPQVEIKGIAHITGGGFIENIPRMLPKGVKALVRRGSWEMPAIFPYMGEVGKLDKMGMYNTFNMGIGMTCCVAAAEADRAVALFRGAGEKPFVIGEVVAQDGPAAIEIC